MSNGIDAAKKKWRAPAVAIAMAAMFAAPAAMASGAFAERFDGGRDAVHWRISKYVNPKAWLDTRWDVDHVTPGEEGLALTLTPDDDSGSGKSFVSGEISWRPPTHYGRYEVVMRAASGEGLTSAFFTYTGANSRDPHDEIDFEFLGRDTTRVWLNYYVDGQPKLGQHIELGFDAAEDFHHYAFEWTPETIRWYADDRLLFEITPDGSPPETPGRIYLSLWAGHPGLKNWLGVAAPDTKAQTVIRCVAFSPLGDVGTSCPRR